MAIRFEAWTEGYEGEEDLGIGAFFPDSYVYTDKLPVGQSTEPWNPILLPTEKPHQLPKTRQGYIIHADLLVGDKRLVFKSSPGKNPITVYEVPEDHVAYRPLEVILHHGEGWFHGFLKSEPHEPSKKNSKSGI